MNKQTVLISASRGLITCALSWFIAGCDVSEGTINEPQSSDDPVVLDFPIAYVQRPLPVDEDGAPVAANVLEPAAFNPGAQLVIKDRASASAAEAIITFGVFGQITEGEQAGADARYDVKDLAVSSDGQKLLFAMRAPELENTDEDEQPTWNIWEFDRTNDELRRVIESDIFAEQGQDVAPQYLPDGRIVFASTRQRRTRAILLGEGKPQYPGLDDKRRNETFTLHVMDPDGADITQITFNASHDLQPTVMPDGRVLFLRWDAVNRHDQLSLYTVNPDGSDLQIHYGFHSQDTGTENSEAAFNRPRALPDSRVLVNLRPRETLRLGGDLITIDTQNFTDIDQPTYANTGAAGPAQESLTTEGVDIRGDEPSAAGYFSSAFPLADGTDRLLVSWSQCRLIDPATLNNAPCTDALLAQGAEQAAPLFGLWIYDTRDGNQLPVKIPEEGTMYTDAVVMAPSTPPARFSPAGDPLALAQDQLGVIHIRSVYDIDGFDFADNYDIDSIAAMADPLQTSPDSRPIRFLRIVKNVPIPDDNVLDFDDAIFGASRNLGMREIIGYVPVEPDGSAQFMAPADVPLTLDFLDRNGQRLGRRHEIWLNLRPGEVRECTGCHTADSDYPHGRREAEAPSAWPGAVGGEHFPNTRLVDDLGTVELPPETGESMAEYYSRIHAPRTPSVDILYTDEWTDPGTTPPGADIALRYLDFSSTISANPSDANCEPRQNVPSTWTPPSACTAAGSWNFECRVTINYPQHIHPLWEADRRECDDVGNLVANRTCIDCHSRGTADAIQVPSGQLELTGEISQDRNDYITSYAELMFEDNQQQVVDNSLTDVIIEVDTGEFETDENGDLILDMDGNPIPIIEQQTVPVDNPMSTAGARDSNRFFRVFAEGGSHYGYLSAAELKLISEWLDIGGQYYNNPFDAPAD